MKPTFWKSGPVKSGYLFLALLACSGMWLAAPAGAEAPKQQTAQSRQAAQPAPKLLAREKQLVGLWQDLADPEIIIRFLPDHTVRVFVPKREGQARNLRWLQGTWELSARNVLTLKLRMPPGRDNVTLVQIKTFNVVFDKEGMVVKSGREVLGRQHRINDDALKAYLW